MEAVSSLHVAYDEQCRLCMGFARQVARWDRHHRIIADGAHAPRHEKLKAAPDRLSALVAWDEDTEAYLYGFAAVAAIVRRLPGGVVAVPVLNVLERTGWGARIYARVAGRRTCSKL